MRGCGNYLKQFLSTVDTLGKIDQEISIPRSATGCSTLSAIFSNTLKRLAGVRALRKYKGINRCHRTGLKETK